MFKKKTSLLATTISLTLLGLTACGGGGGGSSSSSSGTATGLEMPSKLSVVTAKDDGSSKAQGIDLNYKSIAGALVSQATLDGFASTSDYNQDEADYWVHDDSVDALGTVNMILCLMDQTRASAMVNEGAYTALVNEDKCEEGSYDGGGGSGGAQNSSSSSTTQATQLNRWTIQSTRADNDSPQIVKIWVPGDTPDSAEEMEDAVNMLVEVTITDGVTDSKPFGEFSMDFTGIMTGDSILAVDSNAPVSAGDSFTIEKGMLRTADGNPLQFEYASRMGRAAISDPNVQNMLPFSLEERAAVDLGQDVTNETGSAKTEFSESFDGNFDGDYNDVVDDQSAESFNVDFNADYFLRDDGTNQVCLDRNGYNTHTWRYNLYHTADGSFNGRSVTAGQRVKVQSGFPFIYTDNDGEHFGHVGYWGVWVEDDDISVTDLDGQTIQKETFGDSNGESYTVRVGPGKLHKRTKESATFAEMVGVDMNWWGDPNDPTCQAGCPNQGDYRAEVVDDNGTYKVMVTGSVSWGDMGPEFDDSAVEPDVDITPTVQGEQRWMWSDSLGGSVVVKTNAVVFYKEEVVAASDTDATALDGSKLYCYQNCLKGGITTAASSASDLFYWTWDDGDPAGNANAPYSYTVDVVDGQIKLKDDQASGAVVEVPDGIDWTQFNDPWYQDGVQTDEMVTATLNNWYEAYDENVTYRWETGANDWNRQIAVTDSNGDTYSFDKPLKLTLAFQAGDDPNYPASGNTQPFDDGTKFLLEYGGPGQLWGFPWDVEDGCDMQNEDCRWYPALTLKDGVELKNGDTSYVVRAIESEQSMQEDNSGGCATAGLDAGSIGLSLPSYDAIGTPSIAWADRPSVDGAPAVVEGELQ
ncbi:MAG TPA: hypothetical protein VKA64_11000 [Gammaproteobacteria bacterium]|nr:hypothetical protein [Gammaproteobacteria bacterium]